MFNLLPIQIKQEVKSEYSLRRLTIILVFILGLQASFLIFLFPTWLISLYNEKEVVLQSEQASQVVSEGGVVQDGDIIKTLNTKLTVLNKVLEYPKIQTYLDVILSKKTRSISITQVSYALKDATSANMSVSGVSLSRESLVSFVKSLEETKAFKSVDLPISNLAKDKNIDFTINLVIGK